VQVLRRISLDGYADGGDRLTVRATVGTDDALNLELHGAGDARHYRAHTAVASDAKPADWTVPADLVPVPPDVYDGRVLFHGPRFQAIREIDGVAASGAAGILAGAADLGWNRAAWHTDPAAVDGGLQLAVLWAKEVLGRATLPMGVREYRTYRTGLLDGPTRCVVRAGGVSSDGAECDVAFLDPDGAVRAEMFGVSLVARPA
jgi:hypothetical protein